MCRCAVRWTMDFRPNSMNGCKWATEQQPYCYLYGLLLPLFMLLLPIKIKTDLLGMDLMSYFHYITGTVRYYDRILWTGSGLCTCPLVLYCLSVWRSMLLLIIDCSFPLWIQAIIRTQDQSLRRLWSFSCLVLVLYCFNGQPSLNLMISEQLTSGCLLSHRDYRNFICIYSPQT